MRNKEMVVIGCDCIAEKMQSNEITHSDLKLDR